MASTFRQMVQPADAVGETADDQRRMASKDFHGFDHQVSVQLIFIMGVYGKGRIWQGLALNNLQYRWDTPCPTPVRPTGVIRRSILRVAIRRAGWPAAVFLPSWTPHAVRA
jgi:hypothetical protein